MRTKTGVATMLLAGALDGCASFNTMDIPDALPAGRLSAGFAAPGGHHAETQGPGRGNFLNTERPSRSQSFGVPAMGAVRVGVGAGVDLGARATMFAAEADAKQQLLAPRDNGVRAAVSGSVYTMTVANGARASTGVGVGTLLGAGDRELRLVAAPGVLVGVQTGDLSRVMARLSLGFRFNSGRSSVAWQPEVTTIQGFDEARTRIYTGGVGIVFGHVKMQGSVSP